MNKPQTLALALLVAAAIALTSGCGGDAGSEAQQQAVKPGAPPSQSAGDPSAETGAIGEGQPGELNAAHILIMHTGSEGATAEITRTKEEALALAQEIAKKAKAEGADFGALAREHSDCPSSVDGGNLGNFPPDQMVPAFSEATLKLAIGEVSDIVESPFGYHVIRRQKVEVIPKASAKHILVQYKGSMRAGEEITRTKEEALALIQECLKRVQAGEKFEDLAREHSDCPSASRGGDLEEFPQGVMHPAFDAAAFACEVGQITDVVETPFGYHVIYRYK
ncbi:MAG TPA: peptidylprolyl isomerase [Thermoguttaceae bacterium]|nr:peptidylprolyl isomerase [Thermoguttaceae bacterium]